MGKIKLYWEYWIKKLSTREIARKYTISKSSVLNLMKKYKIKSRIQEKTWTKNRRIKQRKLMLGNNNPMRRISGLAKKVGRTIKERGSLAGKNNPSVKLENKKKKSKALKKWWKKNKDSILVKQRNEKLKQYRGDKSSMWKGGISFEPYSSEFNGRLKQLIRERDNFECQFCGISENGRAHDIHHIDYDKKDYRKRNLITLCKNHNGQANYNRDKWQFLFETLQELRGI